MAQSGTLRITVDETSPMKIRALGPIAGGRAVLTRVVEVPADKVRRELRRALRTMEAILNEAVTDTGGYQLDEVSFNVGFNASGKVSLLSLAGGSVSASTGIQFRFRRADAE